VQVSKAATHLVDRRRVEHMSVSGNSLVGPGSLDTLLERASIRNASKDSRNVLRNISEAEADENLILLFRVEVASDVKGVRVLIKVGAVTVPLGAGVRSRVEFEYVYCILVEAVHREVIQVAVSSSKVFRAWSAGTEWIAHVDGAAT